MADKTATSDTFRSGGKKYITQTEYRIENGTATSGTADGSTIKLWEEISARDHSNLNVSSEELLTTGSLSVTPDVASGNVQVLLDCNNRYPEVQRPCFLRIALLLESSGFVFPSTDLKIV